MVRILTKRWYLFCYKYRRRNLKLYPNIYSHESSFIFRGNSKIQFNHKKNQPNKARQVFDETNEKSGNYCK